MTDTSQGWVPPVVDRHIGFLRRTKVQLLACLVVTLSTTFATPIVSQVASQPLPNRSEIAYRADDAARTAPLRPDQPVRVALRRGQEAYFRVADDASSFEVVTEDLDGDTDTVLSALGAENVLLLANDDRSQQTLASRIEIFPTDGVRLIKVGTYDAAGGEFTVRLRRVPTRAIPAAPLAQSDAETLVEGSRRRLRLLAGQQAYFRLPDERVERVVETKGLAEGTDTVLDLLDDAAQVIAMDDDSGDEPLASRLPLTTNPVARYVRARLISPGVDGEFDLVVTRSPDRSTPPAIARLQSPNRSPGSRRAALSPLPAASVLALPARSAADARIRPALRIGEYVSVELDRENVAVFALPFDGRPFVAMTFGLAGDTDTVLELIDAEGNILQEDDDSGGGLASRLEIGASLNPLFLRVRLFHVVSATAASAAAAAGTQHGSFDVGLLRSASP